MEGGQAIRTAQPACLLLSTAQREMRILPCPLTCLSPSEQIRDRETEETFTCYFSREPLSRSLFKSWTWQPFDFFLSNQQLRQFEKKDVILVKAASAWTNAADGSGTMRTGERIFCLLRGVRRAEAAAALCPTEEASCPTNPPFFLHYHIFLLFFPQHGNKTITATYWQCRPECLTPCTKDHFQPLIAQTPLGTAGLHSLQVLSKALRSETRSAQGDTAPFLLHSSTFLLGGEQPASHFPPLSSICNMQLADSPAQNLRII